MYEIRPVTREELPASLAVIRSAFATVAAEMGLTPENCPGHTAFTTIEKLTDLFGKSACFGLYTDGRLAGFVAAEKASDAGVYYLDKLAVLPDSRHKGYGEALVKRVAEYVRRQGGKIVSLGMIDSHMVLKHWYMSLGFKPVGTKKFEHLPFLVCFMDLDLSAKQVK